MVNLLDVELKTSNEFAVVLVSSLDKNEGLKGAKRILITCIARAQNTDMQFNQDHTQLLDVGKAPILLEPVEVSLVLKNKKKCKLYVLNHSGIRTGKEVPVNGGRFLLNGSINKTIYYELVKQ